MSNLSIENRRILVVDDNQAIHNDFRRILTPTATPDDSLARDEAILFGDQPHASPTASPVVIDTALQGEEAISLVRQAEKEDRPYAVAFVDVRMPPGIDGIETTSQLFAISPLLQVVICTAYSDDSWEETVRRLGETDRLLVLKKPFEVVEVRQIVSALTRKWSIAYELESKLKDLEKMVACRTEEVQKARDILAHQAIHDVLTGIPNRRAFYDCSPAAWQRSLDHQRPLSCVMVDLDFFKRVNDTHGHAAGDTTLAAVAHHLADQCAPDHFVCRYGGEEFCLLLPDTDEKQAAEWAERARRSIGDLAVPVGDRTVSVTASFGVAERLSDTADPEDLVKLADEALAVAKQSGRNCVVPFSSLLEPMFELCTTGGSAGPLHNVIARDVMSTAVLCPNQDDTVRQVADLLLQLRIQAAPVVDDDGMVVGIVTSADLMTRTSLGRGWDEPIRSVMRRDVVTYEEDVPASEVYQFLSRVSVPRLVVVDRGRPTGVISRSTLLRWFRNWSVTHQVGDEEPAADDLRQMREHQRAGIIKTAQVAARRIADIPRRIADENQDFVPCVVGEATRLQDLANDLLGQCQASCVPESADLA